MEHKASKATFLNLIKALQNSDQYSRRHDYVFRHTKGRSESTKDVTNLEALAIIKELEDTFKVEDKCDVMRKKVISLAHQMGWQIRGAKANMPKINAWCITYGPYKKALNKHDFKELTKLVSVFEKVYEQFMNKL